MTRSLAVLLPVIAVAAAGMFCGQSVAPGKRAEVGLRHPESLPVIHVDDDKRCADQAREQFHRAGWDLDPHASFSHRYNDAMQRCFIEFDLVIADGNGRADLMRSIADAEGRDYADYVQVIRRDDKQTDVSPTVCEVFLPSGEEMDCSSQQQFNEFIKGYMG